MVRGTYGTRQRCRGFSIFLLAPVLRGGGLSFQAHAIKSSVSMMFRDRARRLLAGVLAGLAGIADRRSAGGPFEASPANRMRGHFPNSTRRLRPPFSLVPDRITPSDERSVPLRAVEACAHYAAHGLSGGWASSLFRAILSSNNSSKRQSGSAILRSSLATIISRRESPKTNCSSAAKITLLFFCMEPFH